MLVIPFVFAVTLVAEAKERHHAMPALTATIEEVSSQTLFDGRTSTSTILSSFYRDSLGRTRIERKPGQQVMIQDPTIQTNIYIDTEKNNAKRDSTNVRYITVNFDNSKVEDANYETERRDLGYQVIEGTLARGTEITTVVPPGKMGNLAPLKQVLETWYSEELELPVMTRVSSSLSGEHTQRFLNIAKDVWINPSIFSIPVGIKVEDIESAKILEPQNVLNADVPNGESNKD
jgi:hypothetical protein